MKDQNSVAVDTKKPTIKKSFKQSGASLLEALLWMAIALIVAGFATSLVKGAFSGSNTLKSGNETKALIAGTRSATGGNSNYGTVSLNAGLIAAGLVPNTLTVSGSTISNSFGGTVTVTGATANFTVTETSIPQDVCTKKLTSSDPGVLSIAVNGAAAITPPVSLATAATQCSTATNTIVYTAS